jgi:PKD repeat protein
MKKASFAKARGPLGLLTGIVVVAAGLFFAPVATASATQLPGPAPIEQRNAQTVTSRPLPSVQIDSGVVWVQVIAGNTVFAGGSFSNARPAGAAAGTNLMPRSNILAYDINTGVATSFAPVINGQVKSMALSPDGATLYVGGSFNSVNGITRWNFAAFNVATGALLNTFQPAVGGSYVNAIVATSTTVYVAGLLGAGNGVTRKNFIAFNASNGALLAWAPTSDLQVDGMVINQSGDRIIAAGRFGLVNGVAQRGLAALDPVTGALLPWAAPATVIDGVAAGQPNAGDAGIWAITIDKNNDVYGTGWVFADVTAGNLEGLFSADGETGNINWIADCHGDHYGVYSDGTNVYSTSHQHECTTMGGPPQSNPESTYMRNATAYTAAVEGTLTRSPYVSSIYADWEGYPAPAAIDWFPDWTTGSFTENGGGQAGWDMTGNGTYLLVGGEFPYVDNITQQGIARFSNATPDTDAPRLQGNTWTGMTAVSHAAGTVRVSIPSNWDRDDLTLTYNLYRTGTAAPIATTTGVSEYWNQPAITFTDTGLAPGSTQQYRITASDPSGNTVYSNILPVTVSNAVPSAYATAVLNDGASLYWRLGTPTGTVESDWAGYNDGTIGSAVTPSTNGAIQGDTTGSATVTGSANSHIYTPATVPTTSAYSMELWFKTTTTSGGKLAGYGNVSTGDSSNYDRHIYMTNAGKIVYGNYDGGTEIVESPTSYNDGAWHHVIGTQGASGMTLYIDGQLIGTQGATTAQAYTGYWRLGGDNLNGWPDQPSSENFSGQLDEFAVYPTALTATQAATHYALGHGQVAPTAAFTDTVSNQTVTFSPTGSSVPSGESIASYSWNFGDGTALSTASNPVHTFATGGTYPVSLTVTSTSTLSGTVTHNVTVAAPHTLPTAVIGKTVSGLTGTFDATGSLAFDGATVNSYLWTFGDGSTSTIAKPVHTYATAGTYPVTLVVTDTLGATSSTAATSVSPTHSAPVPSFSAPTTGLTVAVNASATTASDGATLTYDWNWGDGSTHGSGVSATHKYAAAGNYTVTLTVTDSIGSTATLATPIQATHAAPVAAFTGGATAFTVNVSAATSSASDGATLSYDWNWGDGSAHGTGVTASHTYAGASSNSIILTVTDSLGLTATVTHLISTSHAAPVAAFTPTASGQSLAVDGSASHASDGATLTWDWNWGDGTAHGTGSTATHNYAAPGTYTVTLTVTDSLGSSASASAPVTATAVVYVANDNFARTVASGFGAALTGGSWSTGAGLSVSGGVGRLDGSAGSTRATYLTGTNVKDTDARIQISESVVPNVGTAHFNYVVRHTAAGDYHLKVRITAPGTVTINLAKTVGTTETLLGATKVLTGYTYTPGALLDLRFNLVTSGATTTLNGKVWVDGTAEPAAWTLTTTDTEPTLQVPGQIGVTTYVSGTATNGPVVFTVGALTAQ